MNRRIPVETSRWRWSPLFIKCALSRLVNSQDDANTNERSKKCATWFSRHPSACVDGWLAAGAARRGAGRRGRTYKVEANNCVRHIGSSERDEEEETPKTSTTPTPRHPGQLAPAATRSPLIRLSGCAYDSHSCQWHRRSVFERSAAASFPVATIAIHSARRRRHNSPSRPLSRLPQNISSTPYALTQHAFVTSALHCRTFYRKQQRQQQQREWPETRKGNCQSKLAPNYYNEDKSPTSSPFSIKHGK